MQSGWVVSAARLALAEPSFFCAAGKMGFGLERLLSKARARSWLLGLSFYRLEPLVRDMVFYAGSKVDSNKRSNL